VVTGLLCCRYQRAGFGTYLHAEIAAAVVRFRPSASELSDRNGTFVATCLCLTSALKRSGFMTFFVHSKHWRARPLDGVETAVEQVDLYRSRRSAGAGAIRTTD
jgi:hypothetical protein